MRRGAVVVGACVLALAVTGGKSIRGVSYAVPLPGQLTVAPPVLDAEVARPSKRTVNARRSGTRGSIARDRAAMTAALLVLLAEEAARSGAQ